MLVVNVEDFAADNIHHRTSMQIMEFFCVRHDEVSRPEQRYFFFGEWDRHHGEWAKIILENAEPCQDLRCGNRYRHDRWLLQPRWALMWQSQFSRKNEMPRLKNPGWQVFFPFPSRPSLPVCDCIGCL